MIKQMQWYWKTWWLVMARPIYFYTKLKEESWQEQSLTFLLTAAWLTALVTTLLIFIVQYIPIGATLVEGVIGYKFIIVLPVLVVLASMFFIITILILGGLIVLVFGAAFYSVGLVLHLIFSLWQAKGSLNRLIQSAFYSSAVVSASFFIVIIALLTRFNVLDFSLFRVGYNLIYCLTLLYVYGLWAVMCRRNYQVPKWQALVGTLLPIIVLLIFGFAFDKMALSKIEPWISPLK
jgi:hypothetical protein